MEDLEKVARAICVSEGHDPDADWNLSNFPTPVPAWQDFTSEARAAIKALDKSQPKPMDLEPSAEARQTVAELQAGKAEALAEYSTLSSRELTDTAWLGRQTAAIANDVAAFCETELQRRATVAKEQA